MARRPSLALLAACGSALALLVVWYATFEVRFTSWFDRGVQMGFVDLEDTRAQRPAESLAHLVDPAPFALMSAGLFALALVARRPRVALAAATILLAANVTTQLLKQLTAGPRAYELAAPATLGGELWPSGHTTAAMTLALCLVLVSPARLRPWAAAAGGLFAVAVVYSIILMGWHLPSDVLGGFLVAAGWTFIVLAGLRAAERRWPSAAAVERRVGVGAVLWPALAAAAAATLVVAAVVLSRPESVVAHAAAHTAFAVGASLLGAAGLALATGVALALRR